MYSLKRLRELTDRELVEVHAAICYATAHKPTDKNFKYQDNVERVLMERLDNKKGDKNNG